tara:strand:- start:3148 stop:4137 length:990 start_codon:yes stop_codon:yes gene_type:complete
MEITNLLNRFKSKKVLVLGDVMLDSYLIGHVNRISPEAPVPVVQLNSKHRRLGGAANVAKNLKALGCKVYLSSVIGNDMEGQKIKDLANSYEMDTHSLILSDATQTTVKTRIIGNNQQLIRVDSELSQELNDEDSKNLLDRIEESFQSGIDAIILEDYNKGVLSKKIISSVIQLAKKNNVFISVDPKMNNFFEYKNVDLFKPNLKELKEGLNINFSYPSQKDEFENAIEQLHNKLENKISFVTLSEHGVYIKDQENQHYIAAHLRNISDVSGAGDTVIATATLCMISECSLKQTAEISNLAGGMVCEKPGVVSIDSNDFENELRELYRS